jgi:hypothetical protein
MILVEPFFFSLLYKVRVVLLIEYVSFFYYYYYLFMHLRPGKLNFCFCYGLNIGTQSNVDFFH